MKKFILLFLFCFIVGICGGIFAEHILWPYFVERPLFYQYDLERPPIYITERNEIRIQENEVLQESIEKVQGAVLAVKSETQKGKVVLGSGFIVTSDGLCVVLSELAPQGAVSTFFVNGARVSFQVLKRKDSLALIKLESEGSFPTIPFAQISGKRLGERVFLLGKVSGENGSEIIVNEGIIRSLKGYVFKTNIYEDVALQGSPVFDIEGNLVGLSVIDSSGQVSILPNNEIRAFAGL